MRFKNFSTPQVVIDFILFLRYFFGYTRKRGFLWFSRFEQGKDLIVDLLYKRRGKYSRPFLHFGMIGLVFFAILIGPVIFQENFNQDSEGQVLSSGVLAQVTDYSSNMSTMQGKEVAQFRGGEVVEHVVKEGETISTIAERYNLDVSTILWENNLDKDDKIKPGQALQILPVDGIRHKVKKGETIYTIAKKYGLDETQAQGVVNYPFNEFQDDEDFALTVGQQLMVPDGIKPEEKAVATTRTRYGNITPDAGRVSAAGSFVWPASGYISQGYRFYHKAIDIANRGGGAIVAGDSGTVIVAGWPDGFGYGNRVMVDHGNGYITLYAHLSVINVRVGQTVNRGDKLGMMGSTGRSTGTHLHFEIRRNGVLENPLQYLQ